MNIKENVMRVRLTTTEEMLGSASSNPLIHQEFIASKAPDAASMEEEVAAIGVEAAMEKAMTVFPRDERGRPIIWDYQIKGMFKDSCGMLKRVPGSLSNKLKAYKKEIDGLIFIRERKIPIQFEGEITTCQRPLRAETMQGPRVALASSEAIPEGAVVEFTVVTLLPQLMDVVREWLDYGALRGLGQWRNSGKGKFVWEEL